MASSLGQSLSEIISPKWSSQTYTPVNVDVSNSNVVGPQSLSYSSAPINVYTPTVSAGGYGGGSSQPTGFNSWQNQLYGQALANQNYWQQQYFAGAPGAGEQLAMAEAQAKQIQGYTPSDYPGSAYGATPWTSGGGGGASYGGGSSGGGGDYATVDNGGGGDVVMGPTAPSYSNGNSSVGNGIDAYNQTLGGPNQGQVWGNPVGFGGVLPMQAYDPTLQYYGGSPQDNIGNGAMNDGGSW